MNRSLIRNCWVVVYLGLGVGCSAQKSSAPASKAAAPVVSSISLTRSIVIPAKTVANASSISGDSGTLTMTEGGSDELAEGPVTFEVLPGTNGFIVADPLRKRVVFYDATGKFQYDLVVYFPPESLRALPNNSLSIVNYSTSERYIYDSDGAGAYKTPRLATPSDPDPDKEDSGIAKLLGPHAGSVEILPRPGVETPPIAVNFPSPMETMVSIRRLGSDSRNRTYVAIEAGKQGDTVSVRKLIRKYTADGQDLVEIGDVPLDYAVHPRDEFRLRDGVLYQLMPKATEVRINVWDTNSKP
jgi:hypothetical protein